MSTPGRAETILDRIVAQKKLEVHRLQQEYDLAGIRQLCTGLPPTRPFTAALQQPGRVALIAEIKRASPSKGLLCPDFDPVGLARCYREAGAAALSVLTDEKFFQGRGDYIQLVRPVCDLPVLRKDFIIDQLQIYQSRLLGADAILLIAAVLDRDKLTEFIQVAANLGLDALVEVHTAAEMNLALAAGAKLLGINNRDLHTFHTDINTTLEMIRLMAAHGGRDDVTVVSESGIHSAADVGQLQQAGVQAILVGEALVTAPEPELMVRNLIGSGGANSGRGAEN